MQKSKKIIFLGMLLIALGGTTVGTYLWFKPVPATKSMKTELSISASELFEAFETDEVASNVLYLNKVMEIKGLVREKNTNNAGITVVVLETDDLMFGVNCEFETNGGAEKMEPGDLVTIKGICTGKLLDVVLNRCIFIN
jgi:hypothetical protein